MIPEEHSITTEEQCKYVSTKGIMRICDIYNLSAIQTIEKINENPENHILFVYLHVDHLRNFFEHMHLLQKKIKLVSGSGDTTIPNDIFTQPEFDLFINNPNIIHYFPQNCIINHPKITNIPIGLDYHTMSSQSYWWGEKCSQIMQEAELMEIKYTAAPFYNRQIMCYSNFHFAHYGKKFGYTRHDVISAISKNLVFYEPCKITRKQTWENQTKYAFVLSPFGNGLDCHRTWEALVLGCIVIVRTSPLDVLYKDLPVLIVNDWTEVTQTLLEKTVEEYKTKTFDYKRLTLEYWKSIIHFDGI